MSDQYLIHHNGQQFGPCSKEQIAAMLKRGEIDTTAMVWCEGWPQWVQLGLRSAYSSAPATAVPPPQRKRSKKSSNKSQWIIAGLAIFVLVAGPVGVYVYVRNSQQSPVVVAATQPAAVVENSGSPQNPNDPRFTIVQKSDDGGDGSWFEIADQDKPVLFIKSVSFNGEFSAALGKWSIFRAVPDKGLAFPFPIGFGDTAYVMITNPHGTTGPQYSKTITYVDIDTNRGKFRYRPGTPLERVN
jgi:hypothetical protein